MALSVYIKEYNVHLAENKDDMVQAYIFWLEQRRVTIHCDNYGVVKEFQKVRNDKSFIKRSKLVLASNSSFLKKMMLKILNV